MIFSLKHFIADITIDRNMLITSVNKQVYYYYLKYMHSNYCSVFVADTIQIQMPALSPTMVDGTLVKWLKKEGITTYYI